MEMQVTAVNRVGLGAAFPIFLRNAVLFVAVLMLADAPLIAYLYLLTSTESTWLWKFARYINYSWPLLTMIGGGAVSYATYRILSGQRRSLFRGMGRAIASWSSLGTALMLGLALYAVYLPFQQIVGMGDGWWFALLPSYIVYAVFVMAMSIAVVERCGPLAAMARAVELSRGRRMQIFGLLVALTVLLYVVTRIQSQIMAEFMPGSSMGYLVWWIIPLALWNTVFALHAVFNGVYHYMAHTERGGADVQSLEAVFD